MKGKRMKITAGGALRCRLIAEAGVNHNGDPDLAAKLIDVAVEAGADCVKFQTFNSAALVTAAAPKAAYQTRNTGTTEPQRDMLRRLELSRDVFSDLSAQCARRGIDFLSTPFDLESADFLINGLGLTEVKIGSGDLTNAPLLLWIARQGVQLILSTGMATLADIEEALSVVAFGFSGETGMPSAQRRLDALRHAQTGGLLAQKVTLLQCTSDYPAPASSLNLRAMDSLASAFGVKVGLSDHSEGIDLALAAVARGAQVLEKHFTLDRTLPGPDHRASLEPADLKAMVAGVRRVEAALGSGLKYPQEAEIATRLDARKSVVAAKPIRRGEAFSESNLTVKRPGGGLPPIRMFDLIGRPAARDFVEDEPIDE